MKTRILVVNDTQEILDMFQLLLQEEGYEVILSSFPYQDGKAVEEVAPDLVILDLVFGHELLGWQMLQLLRMQRATAATPVIVCTAALKDVQEQEGYLMSQGIHVIHKPFDIDYLLNVIKKALASYKKTISQAEER